jgi:hypothetical protein
LTGDSFAKVDNVEITVSGAGIATGIYVNASALVGANLRMEVGFDGNTDSRGVHAESATQIALDDTFIFARGASVTNVAFLSASLSAPIIIQNAQLIARGAGTSIGFDVTGNTFALLRGCLIEGAGPETSYGVRTGTSTVNVDINNSTVAGTVATMNEVAGQIRVGGSQLNGGPVAGSVKCAGVFDEHYDFYPDTCP